MIALNLKSTYGNTGPLSSSGPGGSEYSRSRLTGWEVLGAGSGEERALDDDVVVVEGSRAGGAVLAVGRTRIPPNCFFSGLGATIGASTGTGSLQQMTWFYTWFWPGASKKISRFSCPAVTLFTTGFIYSLKISAKCPNMENTFSVKSKIQSHDSDCQHNFRICAKICRTF